MSTTGELRVSPSYEPPPRRLRVGGGLWHDLWSVLVAFLVTVIAGVFVMAICLWACAPTCQLEARW
jgi:hypothetical protein